MNVLGISCSTTSVHRMIILGGALTVSVSHRHIVPRLIQVGFVGVTLTRIVQPIPTVHELGTLMHVLGVIMVRIIVLRLACTSITSIAVTGPSIASTIIITTIALDSTMAIASAVASTRLLIVVIVQALTRISLIPAVAWITIISTVISAISRTVVTISAHAKEEGTVTTTIAFPTHRSVTEE